MFTLPFWIIFGIGVLASLAISTAYGRRAIHPRLRPHFGFVVIVFVALAMASFFLAVLLAKLVDPGPETIKPPPPNHQAEEPS